MGKKSRLKAERRTGRRTLSNKERERLALKAERRGQNTGDSLSSYEHAARVSSRRVAEALIARHNTRMKNLVALPHDYRTMAMSSLAPITLIDKVLRKYGADKNRPPASYAGGWLDQLAWAADSAVAAIRLVLSGQLVGAASLARHQLERWTYYRAFNTDTRRTEGESTQSYIARTWGTAVTDHFGSFQSSFIARQMDETEDAFNVEDAESNSSGEPEEEHEHVTLSDNSEVCPAAAYGILTDTLHAHEYVQSIRWDSLLRCDPHATPYDAYVVANVVADVVSLNLRQVRAALLYLALERKDYSTAHMLRSMPDRFSKPDADTSAGGGIPQEVATAFQPAPMPSEAVLPSLPMLLPLHPGHGLRHDFLTVVETEASLFDSVLQGRRPARRLFRDDELTTYVFSWHRRSSARTALRALENESKVLGEKFNPDSLTGRDSAYILASEASGVLSGWLTGARVSAAALISSATRSAYWLWLEDDDRAMAVLRSVLEQVARMRVWRTKPEKAAQLEASPKTTPRDWLNAAGWRRLEALNRALGELVHARVKSRWHGARELLAKFQVDVDPEMSISTARGNCLDFVITLACREVIETTKTISATVGDGFAELFQEMGLAGPETNLEIDTLMDHIWHHRTTPLGDPTFQGPALAWEAGQGPSGIHRSDL